MFVGDYGICPPYPVYYGYPPSPTTNAATPDVDGLVREIGHQREQNRNLMKAAKLLLEYYDGDYLFVELVGKRRLKIDKRTRRVLRKIGLISCTKKK